MISLDYTLRESVGSAQLKAGRCGTPMSNSGRLSAETMIRSLVLVQISEVVVIVNHADPMRIGFR